MTVSVQPDSPCTGVCRMDEASGLCIGCRRTQMEIATWLMLGPDARAEVRARAAARPAPPGCTSNPGAPGNPGCHGNCATCAHGGGA